MRARQIIYRHYSDTYTKQLKKLIKQKLKDGDGFEARIYNTRLQRWVRAATGETVTRQIMGSLKNKLKQHKKDCGREKLTLRDINRLRKERYALTRAETSQLETVERMYGNNNYN